MGIQSFFGLIYWNILTMVVSLVRVLLRSGVGCVWNMLNKYKCMLLKGISDNLYFAKKCKD